MLETAGAIGAGLAAFTAILAVASRPPLPAAPPWLVRRLKRWWLDEGSRAQDAGVASINASQFVSLQLTAAFALGFFASLMTGLLVMALPGALAGASLIRGAFGTRARKRQVARQDAVLDAVRMLRQLLETGATSVNQAVVVLAERGPLPLRGEFRTISARSVGRRQAWKQARERVAEPLFDMLAAAVLIQRPGGGELVPLFADLEASVTAAQEVEREARALQAQARSASTIIVALPLVFLLILSTLHSPYLDAFHRPEGEVFLLAMLATMAAGYVLMRRLLELPGLQRVRLTDA
ncbi:MAG: type II secretion system F family protein [Candidatus Dormibacteraceae bacterium]